MIKIGSIVESKDIVKYPLRSTYEFYKQAVVVSLNPLVLVSLDATMIWKHFPMDHVLEVFLEADQETLNKCALRFNNDKVGEVRYDEIDSDTIPSDDVIQMPKDERTAYDMFVLLHQYMESVSNGSKLIAKQTWLVMFDTKVVSDVEYSLGSISIRFMDNTIFRLPKDSFVKMLINVYKRAYSF